MGSLIQLWLAIRPIKRIREARAAKRAEQAASSTAGALAASLSPESVVPATGGAAPIQQTAAPAAEGGIMGGLAQSMMRSVLKVFGAALVTWAVTHGMVDAGQTDALMVALETVVGGVLTIGGLWWSHRTHVGTAS